MMMTTEELKERLEKIDKKLELIVYKGEPDSLYLVDGRAGHRTIYDFTSQKYNAGNCFNYIPDKFHDLNKLLDDYYEGRNETLARDNEDSVDSTDTENYPHGYTAKELDETAREIAKSWKKFGTRPTGLLSEENPFKEYTDKLAQTLLDKNKDYGDSFSRSVDKFGIIAAVVRLEDKFNRLENLTANGDKEKVKDESLADTALDISGYGLLLYKYLKEHERTSK